MMKTENDSCMQLNEFLSSILNEFLDLKSLKINKRTFVAEH